MPCGPSSVARLWASAEQRGLGHLVRAERQPGVPQHRGVDHHDRSAAGRERRGEQPGHPQRGRARWSRTRPGRCPGRRSAEAGQRRDRERVVHQRVDPAERLERGLRQVGGRVGVGDVGRARPPRGARAPVTSVATSSRRAPVRAASTTSAPARALCSAIARPRPGPTPETTTTLPAQQAQRTAGISPASGRRRRPGGRRSAPRTPPASPAPARSTAAGPAGRRTATTSTCGPSAGPRSRVSRCQRICT